MAMPNFNNLMTLGELIDALGNVDGEKSVITSGGSYVGGFSSYRGYYEELAITPTSGYSDEGSILDVAEFLEKAKECVGKYFTGWKGGEYRMDRDNALWIAHQGQCPGIGLKKIKVTDYNVILYGKRTSDA